MANFTLCRLCLGERDPSFTEVKQDDELIDLISTLSSIEPLPDSIETIVLCNDCLVLLTQFGQFREGCIHNDVLFRERLQLPLEETFAENVRVVIIEEDEAKQLGLLGETDESKEIVRYVLVEDAAKKDAPTNDEEQKQSVNHHPTRKNPIKQENVQNVKTKESSPNELQEQYNINRRQTRKRQTKQFSQSKVKKASKPNPGLKQDKSAPDESRTLACAQCGKMIRRGNMRKHLATHNPQPPQLFCSHCGKMFRDSYLLKVHINSNHTFERKYECTECGKVYFRPNSLREHVYANHSEEKRYECQVCGMKFSNFSKKTYHYIKVHTSESRFSCQYCNKAFKIKSDYTLHVRTHTGEKPFSCDICGKRFNKSYNVVIHKKSHRNEEARETANSEEETVT
uniref:Protein krueppel n=1 Tax=Anopheles epiroticus TaxID=199890 RepID=A0A182PC93_9DIPT